MTIAHPAPTTGRIPPLQNGDRLTRAEFERRFDATPNLKKAELIEGVVYMPPPVSFAEHGGPHFDVVGWLGMYRITTRGVRGGDNASLRLDLDNMPQPDAFLLIRPEYSGQARINTDGYVEGAPELVLEVAASSVSDYYPAWGRDGRFIGVDTLGRLWALEVSAASVPDRDGGARLLSEIEARGERLKALCGWSHAGRREDMMPAFAAPEMRPRTEFAVA